ncbi:MAG TPA: YciI family protein [Solirubrobacteraceae bacterium]|nr:YciI family protein [Solirubrobacteraceae bacterium]
MGNYLLAYTGGSRPESEEEQQAAMAAWGAWFHSLGEAVVDGGAPFGGSASLNGDGGVSEGGTSGLTGYSVLTADSLDAATELAKGCPLLADGGGVEVYEAMEM